MKAAVFHGPNELRLEEVKKPVIGEEEVLVKVNVSAVCGTDVRIFEGKKTKGVRTPSIIGHELVGTIDEVGEKVTGFFEGDRVGIMPVIPCRKCHYCMNGQENVCENRTAIGYEFDGGFAEYVKIPGTAIQAGNLVKLPDNVSFEQAVVAEPLACCLNGQKKTNVKMGDVVVVTGGGPIGLMHVQLAKIAGAKKVILSEPIDHRREKALEAGADLAVNPMEESLHDIILSETDGLGADVVIMAIGVPSLVNSSASLLKKGGTLNLFAGFTKGVLSEIDPNIIHYNEINVNGTSALTRANYHQSLALIASGQINTEVLTTTGYTLDNIEQAINDVRNGTGMKSVITI
ncbi:zinc-dependent dehydrogenase [Bacillus sp. ISL-35]|uniref:zinc-dependent dehydrogenase n=1 Tax=Bacillus sp. ISL-35 TaxID=2819122 RepID=UPI001BE55788|nr:zinc-dependent dehydrogenase [Bacillus sp. ISL-35]MBT2678702.1 zinc-dependent dehydrogenase [Bacillus sp. ISL-35]MBT2703694.1 zinc-dependent dehydrogenase [Chryseobacterium sp. ISL-80]